MENLFITLQKKIAENISGLSLIDEDCGQLQSLLNGEDTYPVTFPCVLIGDIVVDWNNLTPYTQQGNATITVRLAFDCYDDTHYGSGTADKVLERMAVDNQIYKLLQGYKHGRGRLKRTKSVGFSLPGAVKVYETIFSINIVDESAASQ